MTQEQLTTISIAIASLSLAISFATLYFSQLAGPNVVANIGPYIKVFNGDYAKGISTGIYVPVSFFNKTVRSSVVKKTAVEIFLKKNDQKRYVIFGKQYSEFDSSSNSWKMRDIAYALPILGKSSIQKTIRYNWDMENQEKLLFEEGVYTFNFMYWIEGKENPESQSHELVFDSAAIKKLDEFIKNKKSTTVDVMLNRQMPLNKLMTKHESERMIGNQA
ncbi:hypothetical protein [Rheinheimera sp. 4Y26]|uniref:hypothetical protein n=1 Tax=Rheinheimera sp. 4Y26 TaxID=2977811 RepID=UPI0021B10752|nr:hypothetical protein [Rheinheimera sp. 4Y26]MCT6698676.1 hypothetical protein [Rheinheimera sp. 4Y26]